MSSIKSYLSRNVDEFISDIYQARDFITGLLTPEGRKALVYKLKVVAHEVQNLDRNDYIDIGIFVASATALGVIAPMAIGTTFVYFSVVSLKTVTTITKFTSLFVYGVTGYAMPNLIRYARGRRHELATMKSTLVHTLAKEKRELDILRVERILLKSTPDQDKASVKLLAFMKDKDLTLFQNWDKYEGHEDFYCIITRDIMFDPVIAGDKNYSREALKNWYLQNNKCPHDPSIELTNPMLLPANEVLAEKILNAAIGQQQEIDEKNRAFKEWIYSEEAQELRRSIGVKNSTIEFIEQKRRDRNQQGNNQHLI